MNSKSLFISVIIAKIFIIFISLFLWSSCRNNSDDEEIKTNYLTSAKYNFNNNLKAEAIKYCDKALTIDSLYKEALFLKILSMDGLKKYDDYLNNLNKLLRIDSLHYDGYLYRAEYFMNSQEYSSSINDYKKAITIEPKNELAFALLGNCYNAMEEKDSALYYFNKCIQINPNSPFGYNQRGGFFFTNMEFKKAYDDLTHSVSLDSTDAYPLYNLGVLKYSIQKKYDEGCADMKKAFELGYAGSKDFYEQRCVK